MTALNFIEHPLVGTPFGFALDLCLLLAVAVWLLSVLTRDYSLVDNLWSLLPPVYCLIVAAHAGFGSLRVNLMTALVIAWSARLTFNHARKGGLRFRNMDYRWGYTREKLGPVGFQVLNITFIAPGQMLLIWLFTSPVHQAWLAQETPLGWLDFLAAALFVVLFVGQATGDEQMWRFQQDKKKRLANGETVTEPFITTGLFRYCRHPSYFCELGMWWVFYLFAVAASGQWLNWTAFGVVLLTALLIGSTRMTEVISAAKYPGYRDYQMTTRSLVPLPRRRLGR